MTSPTCSSPPSGATTYSYDSDGDRTAVNGATTNETLGWTKSSERLICVNTSGSTCSVTSPSSSTTLYSYDGNGLRTSSTNQGVTTHFAWDPSSSELLSDSSHDYVYEPGSPTPMAQIGTSFTTTPTVDLLVCDTNLNTRGVVQIQGDNSSLNGTLVNYTDYDAYGNPITQAGGTANPGGLSNLGVASTKSSSFGFGASYENTSGLSYLVNRYYDDASGQFVSVDPMLSQTNEPFAYVEDNPVMHLDPHGQCDFGCWTKRIRAMLFKDWSPTVFSYDLNPFNTHVEVTFGRQETWDIAETWKDVNNTMPGVVAISLISGAICAVVSSETGPGAAIIGWVCGAIAAAETFYINKALVDSQNLENGRLGCFDILAGESISIWNPIPTPYVNFADVRSSRCTGKANNQWA